LKKGDSAQHSSKKPAGGFIAKLKHTLSFEKSKDKAQHPPEKEEHKEKDKEEEEAKEAKEEEKEAKEEDKTEEDHSNEAKQPEAAAQPISVE